MKSLSAWLFALILAFAGCSSRGTLTPAPSPPAAPQAATAARASAAPPTHAGDPGWPRTIVDDAGWRVTVHQPEVVSWIGGELVARLAAVVVPPDAPAVYAAIHIRAHADADKHRRLVALDDVALTRAHYAAPAIDQDAVDRALHRNLPRLLPSIALDRLLADLVDEDARVDDTALAVRNDPPRIFVAHKLAVLLPVDGASVWRRATPRWQRLVNTRALVLRDRPRRWLYAYVGDTWYRARALAGPWRTATLIPGGIDTLRDALIKTGDVDLFDTPGTPLARALWLGRVPDIIVAKLPAELIVVDGAPALAPIVGTTLASVDNSDADLFRNSDGKFYVLLSGRWFVAAALDGPWRYVAPGALPDGFESIPPDHPRAHVMASVPGTALAAEARIVDEVPEIATLRRADLTLQPTFDGAPRFVPLAAGVRWAINSATPVLEADGLFWALADAVWFVSPHAEGPWRAAKQVPDSIYALPPTSPLHFVTYARIYQADDERVRVGYTPGYFGACLGDDGVVVFGNGVAYAPFVGTSWLGRPATYGLRARWRPGRGWTFGSDAVSPWWSPFRAADGAFADERADLFARWGNAVAPRARVARFDLVDGADDLYVGSDERVYRAHGDGWERRGADGWTPVTFGSLQASIGGFVARDELAVLQRARAARREGAARYQRFALTP